MRRRRVLSEESKPGWRSIPIAGILLEPGSALKYKTGDWRAFRPVIDKEKCVNCLLCWIYCPDGAIIREEKKVSVNYEYCKGCGICANECPVKAITMVEERR
ncbi:4Fe-4S dicluster domain-containing protein [Candidatus Bathyarchaeota archaeon]|nr:MAG: 4Fe-4S dicluster domain-containing protein [Candidatus Bathyarchaeota archaeon]